MRKLKSAVIAIVASVVYCMSYSAALATDGEVKAGTTAVAKDQSVKSSKTAKVKSDAEKIGGAASVVKEIAAIPKMKIPPELIRDASAIVLVPGATKNDLMASNGSAGGVLLVHDKEGKWSSPVFISISGGTLGWQIVSDPMDIVLVFKNRKNVDAVLNGKFDLDARIEIVTGRLGTTMKGATASELKADITTYVRSHGEFIGSAVVAGTTMRNDSVANDAFYANPKVNAGDIVSGKVVKSTEDIKALQKLLTDYASIK